MQNRQHFLEAMRYFRECFEELKQQELSGEAIETLNKVKNGLEEQRKSLEIEI